MDIIPHYLRPPIRQSRPLWFAIITAAGISLALGAQAYQQYQRAEQATLRNQELLAAKAQTIVPLPSSVDLDKQKRWAALKVERDFAWEPLFHAVEQAANSDIELLEFQPEKNSRHMTLRGEARDRKALTTFIAALAAPRSLGNVHLVHQQTMTRDRLETVSFEIKATLLD